MKEVKIEALENFITEETKTGRQKYLNLKILSIKEKIIFKP